MTGWLSQPSQTRPRILQWAEQYPRLVRLREIETFSGQTACAVTVTDAEATGAKRGLLVAQPHAHEPATTAGMMNFLRGLLTGEALDGEPAGFDAERLRREMQVTFIPDGNPAGRARAPVDCWDGSRYTNKEFLDIAFGTTSDGERFPRQGRWSLDEQRPATVGIVYEPVNEREFVEPNRDVDSTYFRLLRGALAGGGIDGRLSLHQTEFDRSEHNCEILLPFDQAELPAAIRDANVAWGRAVIHAWREAGAHPDGEPRPLAYGEDQLRYFRACFSGIHRSMPGITVEIQNNNPRTPRAMQRRLQEIAIQTSIEHLLTQRPASL